MAFHEAQFHAPEFVFLYTDLFTQYNNGNGSFLMGLEELSLPTVFVISLMHSEANKRLKSLQLDAINNSKVNLLKIK